MRWRCCGACSMGLEARRRNDSNVSSLTPLRIFTTEAQRSRSFDSDLGFLCVLRASVVNNLLASPYLARYSRAACARSYSSRAECRSQSAAAEFVSRLSEGGEGTGAAERVGLSLRSRPVLGVPAEAQARAARGATAGCARLPQRTALQWRRRTQCGAQAFGAAAFLQVPAARPLHHR